MKRPTWLDPSISFRRDTPDWEKVTTPVLLDIHSRDSKIWKWGVEIDFIGRPCASSGAWAQIDEIAHCCGGEPLKCAASNRRAMRGSWFQFNFKTAKGAFRFAQQSLLFIQAMETAGVGLIPHQERDPLSDLFMAAQQAFQDTEREAKWLKRCGQEAS